MMTRFLELFWWGIFANFWPPFFALAVYMLVRRETNFFYSQWLIQAIWIVILSLVFPHNFREVGIQAGISNVLICLYFWKIRGKWKKVKKFFGEKSKAIRAAIVKKMPKRRSGLRLRQPVPA